VEADRVAGDLIDTMRSFPGCVGLAAPQIGELVRVAVVDCSEHPRAVDPNGLMVLVNPRISWSEGAELAREGCLSIPELTGNVRRATSLEIGGKRSVGFEARCIQHELDHLDGILFLDRVESLAHDLFVRKVYKH
jgi:peptide deformylase